MYMTKLRPIQPGDQQKADAIVAAAKAAMAPYEDYHKALADGYRIFLPDVPQPQYHFTNYEYALESRVAFRSRKAAFTPLQKNSGRIQTRGRDVHRPRRCD